MGSFTRKLEKLGETLAEYVGAIPYIHHGGCGLVTMRLHDSLANHNIESTLFRINRLMHVVVCVGETFIDGKGILAKSWDEFYDVVDSKTGIMDSDVRELEPNILEELLKPENRETWNCSFDRERYQEQIEDMITVAVTEQFGSKQE